MKNKTKKTNKKKVRVFYYEDEDVSNYMNSLPYHTKSDFIRRATRLLMKKKVNESL